MLAIAGGKGGAGKTTTALGLAAALDGPVVVADADLDMPNLHSMAGVSRAPPEGSQVGVEHPSEPAVRVVPAPTGDRTRDLVAHLTRLAGEDHQLLVDCPAGAGPDAVAPMRAADRVLLVSSLCAPSLRAAAKTAAMARAIGTPPIGVVLTRTRLAPDGIESLLGVPVLGTVPLVEYPVLEAAAVRDAYSRIARRFQNVNTPYTNDIHDSKK
jgi:septum site-determining protein MinD